MRFVVPQGEFELHRYPRRPNETLQAWDAGDELMLRHYADSRGTSSENLLIVNDSWGALSTALASRKPLMLSDSYLAHKAAGENLTRNQLQGADVKLLKSFDPLPDHIDTVLIKVPKSLAVLEDQLHRLAPQLHEKTTVLAAGMTRHIHMSTLDLFAKIIGPTRTSHAEKKARLIFSEPARELKRPTNPWPKTYAVIPGLVVATNHAGTFAAERLDRGTRLLLEHLPRLDGAERVVDLGCGNGVLGVTVAISSPSAEITFIDESYRAVASAESTFRENLGSTRSAHFLVGNGLFDLAGGARLSVGFDVILNNPPFHESHAITDQTAWQMFVESRDALQRGGELFTVGNRHLEYQGKLKRLFGNCEIVAADSKFVVLCARKR